MWTMRVFILVLLVVLRLSISSSKYIEDASELHEQQQDDDENTEDTEVSENEEETDSDEDEESNNNEDNSDTGEEVVNIPGRSAEEREEPDDSEDEDEEYGENEDEQDERMMESDEGGLPVSEEVAVYSPEQTETEGFKRRVEELNKANENIQMTIDEMNKKIDEALSSDSKNGPSDISVESNPAVQHDVSNSFSSINKGKEDTTGHLKQAGAQHETGSDDPLAIRYSEIGEDANVAPDEDY